MHFGRIYLDSNVFIRAFEGTHDAVVENLLEIFRLSSGQAEPALVTSQMTLAEILVHPVREENVARQLQYQALLANSSTWLDVEPVGYSVLVEAATFRVRARMKLPDAIHAATAKIFDCSHILTGDADFTEIAMPLDENSTTSILDWLRSR